MALFWYPAIDSYSYYKDGKIDKEQAISSYIRYFLARLQSMFKYEGLPDTIPAKWFEHYLLTNGNCIVTKVGDDLYAFVGGMGGNPNEYYIPTEYIVSNPYMKQANKTYTIDSDCVLVYNDTYAQGLLPMLQKYCSQLVENDITMNIADILARASLNISTADERTKASAELYLKRLRDGDLGVMMEKAFIEGLNVREFTAAANSITNLIELHQYIKASLYNDLGLNSNYNMKRESINSNESQLNDDMLHPLIDNMLTERQSAIDKINTMYGTNISVSFNSAWEINEREEEAAIENLEAVDDIPGDDQEVPEDDTEGGNDNDEVSDN